LGKENTMRNRVLPGVLFLAILGGTVGSSEAGFILYTGTDLGAGPTDPRPSSDAAAASFAAAAAAIGPPSMLNFEAAPLGGFSSLAAAPGVTVTGVDRLGDTQAILGSPYDSAHPQNGGFNTTAGGSRYVNMVGGTLTFTFASPTQFFGAYLTGVQTSFVADTITFNDGASQTITIPGSGTTDVNGEIAFVGFTDPGKSISSLTIHAGAPNDPTSAFDVIGVDDVTFQAVPEPSSLSLGVMALVAGALFHGLTTRWRRPVEGTAARDLGLASKKGVETMRTFTGIVAICGWLGLAPGARADQPLPEGTWHFNGTGYQGKLVLKVGDGGRVAGTVYDQPIAGSYDAAAGRLTFVRQCEPGKPTSYQAHKGYLFSNDVGGRRRYTLAGTFLMFNGSEEVSWYAQLTEGMPPGDGDDADPPAPGRNVPLPEGSWYFNGTGYETELVVKVDGDDHLTGTVYGQPIAGSYNAGTGRVHFLRMCVPDDLNSYQVHTGYLFCNQVGNAKRYTLAGTFTTLSDAAEVGWIARIDVSDGPPLRLPANMPRFEKFERIVRHELDGKVAAGYGFEVLDRGRVVAHAAEGWARAPWEKVDPSLKWTLDKPMSVASVSKTVTAVALLRLWEEKQSTGRGFSLDQPFWPFLKGVCPEAHPSVKRVTFRNLLMHKSGFPVSDQCGNVADLQKLLLKPLAHPPGTVGSYQNNNYFVLIILIEQIAHDDYTRYTKAHVLAPMGITHMDTHVESQRPMCGYLRKGVEKPGFNFDWQYGWFASVSDLGRFLDGIRTHRVLSSRTTAEMVRDSLGWDGNDPCCIKNGTYSWYSGEGSGHVESIIAHFPDGVDAVLLVNCEPPTDTGSLVVRAWRESRGH
jgi:CubicO group peptidase (beta-lactamase class C family)